MQVEKERGVILSEWLSKRDAKRDSDTAFLLELLNGSHYSERMTIGDTAVIRNCKREDISGLLSNMVSSFTNGCGRCR